jgi:23S rRNA (cytidine1920-2'-O)/16S rRNA (cytidine1409-2'-O)-methyltransferase
LGGCKLGICKQPVEIDFINKKSSILRIFCFYKEMTKQRLDLLLLEKKIFESRQKAQAAIMAGLVKVGEKIIDKPGTLVNTEEEIILDKSFSEKFVSRGGLKLEKAITSFKPEIKDKVFLDIGASTGGFTDCLLKNGAKFVYAIDVGYGQFDWGLRQDKRVKVVERCNARYLTPQELYSGNNEIAQAAVMDVSFISLSKVIPGIIKLMTTDFYIIALVKPQFEAGREKVKKGVVTSPEIHKEVLNNFHSFIKTINLTIFDLTFSPVKGPSGNIEFLVYITHENSSTVLDIDKTVEEAHIIL